AWELITYPSAVGPLSAYATKVKTDGKRRPGVLFVEGGFGGPSTGVFTPQGSHNDQSATAFEQAGMVVMAPSFRGEAGNPGLIESFYGETEDLLAALQTLRDRPDVDPDLVYMVGHSTGGTQVLNAAVATDTYRAAFVFGGRAEMSGLYGAGEYGPEPFDPTNKTEIQFRSAIHWAHHLKRPLYYFEGENAYLTDAVTMAARSPKMQAFAVPNADHFTVLQPVKQLIVQQIVEDTAVEPKFTFSEASLYTAMKDAAGRQKADAAADP
ncbi:MAG: alpha/beta hydrolase family protein, partial [Myxococcota bacterium]